MSTPDVASGKTEDAQEAALGRRAVLEGLVVAVAAGVGGFAWFTTAGPAGEDELDDQQDELEDEQDELEDEQDEDRSGPGGGDDDGGHGDEHDDHDS